MKFERYTIVPLRNHADPVECVERLAQFWGLYGVDEHDNAYAIGDFSSKADAEQIRSGIESHT